MDLLSPAKLNLFLHITGRRSDGYHDLQTVFQLLDYGDRMNFSIRTDGECRLKTKVTGVDHDENLIIKAARALKEYTRCDLGADITIDKKLPLGSGLGGGSSNAATTLIALNHLWQTGLSKRELCDIGVKLGADLPVFVQGRSAWAEGIGERLQAVDLPENWYLVIKPNCSISTSSIFRHEQLTRDSLPITVADFFMQGGRNDCEEVVIMNHPEVSEALDWLEQYTFARLTGTGACIFGSFSTKTEANSMLEKAQAAHHAWQCFVAQGRNKSPLISLVS